MAGIFISYRREDSAAVAGRLFDRLSQHFGKDQVFRDIDTIDPGAEFAKVIAERIAACDVLVALIGKDWLDARDTKGERRLDQPRDFVRAEIAEALAQQKLVIPALIEGAAMPARDGLPEEMAALADRNAIPIGDSRFDYDVGRLVGVIEKTVLRHGSVGDSATAPQHAGLWAWLSDAGRQRTPTVVASQGSIAAGGNVTATASPGGVAIIASGPVTVGITLAEYEERLKKREQDLRDEFTRTSKADKEKMALLEKQLAAVEAKARSPADNFEKYKKVLAGASESLERVEPEVPAEELDKARQALARGDTGEAERLFEKALGQDKLRAAEAAYQLGKLAESRIDYAKADKHYAEAIKLQPENGEYLNAAACIAYELGRYADAQPLLEHALAIRKKSLGPDHPDVATSLNNLAALYRAQGLYAKAEPLYQQSLAIRKKSLGPDHPNVATSLENYAELLTKLKRDEEAAELRSQTKAIRARLAGR